MVTIVIADYDMIDADKFYRHIFKLYDADKKVLTNDPICVVSRADTSLQNYDM